MAPKITVVIGTFNRLRVVNTLINQLKNISDIEVLVFDQSDEKNYQLLKRSFPKKSNFKLYHLDKPSGVQFLNLGWQKAQAPIVLYFDDDVEITEKTISAHLRAYKDFNVKVVAGRVINDNEEVKERETLVGKIQWFGAVIHKNFSSKINAFSDFPYGCNMSYRKEALAEIGGFDQDLRPPVQSYNEVDIGYRINKRWPGSLLFEPDALVYHHRYPSGGVRSYDSKTLAASNTFNYGYFIGKNFSVIENSVWFLRRFPYQILKEPQAIAPIIKGFVYSKTQKIKASLTKENIFVFFLFFLAFITRFWQVPEHFYFGIDEEYQSLLALSIIKDFHIIWIGLSAANTGFYIAPGFVYLHSLLLWLSKLDPIILGYAASTISFITIVIFYFVMKHLFDKKTALITTLVYSFSSFVMNYDRRFWNSTFVPLTVILFFLSLVKSEKNPLWYILVAILLGLSFHIHASLFIFIPIVILVLIYRYIKTKTKKLPISYLLSPISVISIVLFLLLYSPLIVFDFVHNFDNLKTPLRMIQQLGKSGAIYSFQQHLQTIQSTLLQFWSFNSFSLLINYSLSVLVAIIFVWFFVKTKNEAEKILSFIILSYLFMFFFYPGTVLDYYFIGFFPFFSIIIALFLKQFYQISLIALAIMFILPNSVAFLQSAVDGNLESKKTVVKKTIDVLENHSFYLETTQPYVFFGGWRYLFEAYGNRPSASQSDQMFGWIYPKEISVTKPELKVIITTNPRLKFNRTIKKISSGSYSVFILRNK